MTVIPGVTYQRVGDQWVAPGRASLPAVTTNVGRPTGPGYQPYENIASSAAFGPRVDSVGTSLEVTLDVGVFEFSNFLYPPTPPTLGALIYTVPGVHGSGIDQTFIRMVSGSSTRASSVPVHNPPASNGQVNPLWLFRIGGNGTYPRHLSGFTLEGTEQSHNYNGLILYQLPASSSVKRVRVRGIPGSASREPGETFPISTYQCNGTVSNPILLEDCEVDGRRVDSGVGVSASGFAVNFGTNTMFNRCNSHHVQYSHGYALYTTSNLSFVQCKATNTALNGFNFEKVSGTVVLDRPEVTANGGFHIGIFTNAENAVYNITDPIIEGQPISSTNKLEMRVTGYNGLARTQVLSDIHLTVNGVSRPDLMTQTLT